MDENYPRPIALTLMNFKKKCLVEGEDEIPMNRLKAYHDLYYEVMGIQNFIPFDPENMKSSTRCRFVYPKEFLIKLRKLFSTYVSGCVINLKDFSGHLDLFLQTNYGEVDFEPDFALVDGIIRCKSTFNR